MSYVHIVQGGSGRQTMAPWHHGISVSSPFLFLPLWSPLLILGPCSHGKKPRPTWPRSGSGSPSVGWWHCLRWLATATARAQHNVPHLGRTEKALWNNSFLVVVATRGQHESTWPWTYYGTYYGTMAFFRHITVQCQNMSKSESVGHSTPVR